jgi:2-hydroxychromene-2-carboxylate isomerase
MEVGFWFEFASTYSYPAAMRVEGLARTRGLVLRWRPFLLGPIFRSQGWEDSPFNLYPAKGRYMWRDMERTCAARGLPFRRPSRFPRNGLLAARVVARFAEEPWIPAFVRSVYAANFASDAEISEPAVLEGLLGSAGAPANALEAAGSEEARSALRRRTEEAAALGLFGAPSFTVGDEIFWGNDRMEEAFDWAAQRTSTS